MHTQDGLVDLRESAESSSSMREKKERKYYPVLHWNLQRSFRAPENAPHKDQNNTTPARTAVLNTPELLYEILSKVPLNHFASLRRVSKTWNTIVHKLGYYINPIHFHTNAPERPYSYPEYAETIPITFNPIFARHPEPTRSSREHYVARFQADSLARNHTMRKLGHQFLTSPPITQISLSVLPFAPGGAVSVLRVQNGIRLRDLAKALEAFCKLSLDVDSLVFHSLSWSREDLERFDRCRAHVVGAHVFCVKGEVDGASNGLFARVMGVIRRRTKIGGAED